MLSREQAQTFAHEQHAVVQNGVVLVVINCVETGPQIACTPPLMYDLDTICPVSESRLKTRVLLFDVGDQPLY